LLSKTWGPIRGWDAATGKEAFSAPGRFLVWSPDGRKFAALEPDKSLQETPWPITIREAATGKELHKFLLHGNGRGSNLQLLWSPDGRSLAGGVGTGWARIWDAATGKEERSLFGLGNDPLLSVAWSPDGRRLVTGSHEGNLTAWDSATGKKGRTFWAGLGEIHTLAWSPNGQRIAARSADGAVAVCDAVMGKEALRLIGPQQGAVVIPGVRPKADNSWLAWSPDGRWLASPTRDRAVTIWETATGKERHSLRGHTDVVGSLSWSPDGERLASASVDKTVKVWEVRTGQEEHTLRGHSNNVISVAWHPDGQRLVSASIKEVIVWDTGSWQQAIALEGLQGPVSWWPNSQRLLVFNKADIFNRGQSALLLNGTSLPGPPSRQANESRK
jgi:WD40 repeat protein